MREFIGHTLKVLADNFPGPVEGVMVDDKPNMILLKGKDGKVTRVVKSHISGFTPMDCEPNDYVPFHVLYCSNADGGCPGVSYVHEGAGVAVKDYEAFMGACPCRSDRCRFGTKGELRTVAGSFLRDMMAGTMYGEYPRKGALHGAASKQGAAKAGASEGSGE